MMILILKGFTIILEFLSFIKQVDTSPKKIKQLDDVNRKALTYANIKSKSYQIVMQCNVADTLIPILTYLSRPKLILFFFSIQRNCLFQN